MKVPFLDLKAQWKDILPSIKNDMSAVMDSCAFIGGPHLDSFEEKLAKLHHKKHAIGVSSGTDALYLILKAMDIGPGDEVLVPGNSFIASAFAVSQVGATPVFCDVYPHTYLLDINDAEKKVTDKTVAVMPVHLYGQSVSEDELAVFAVDHDLKIIEDAAQAICNKKVGFSKAAAFSFYPGKNLGAFGEAGAVITSDDELAEKIRMLVNQGQSKKYIHNCKGGNYRLDALQAVVLNHGVDCINEWTSRRQAAAKIYDALLPTEMTPKVQEDADHVYHLYELNLRVRGRQAAFVAFMKDKGIACGLHYPKPIHMQTAYGFTDKATLHLESKNLPVVENLAVKLVSLPIFPTMSMWQINYVAKSVKEFLAQA